MLWAVTAVTKKNVTVTNISHKNTMKRTRLRQIKIYDIMIEHDYYNVMNNVALETVKINSKLIADNMTDMMYTADTFQYQNEHNSDTRHLMMKDLEDGVFTKQYLSLKKWQEKVAKRNAHIASEINDRIITPLRQIYYDITNIENVCNDLHKKWVSRGKSFK